jgi:heterodisulfide reductase subunit A
METKLSGSVMVIGGGIAGIQASLDLADSGFRVYLVESSPAIGGTMSQLDKTFPTNDCSLCILSPKLVECGRHLNINVMPSSELKSIDGEPGNFRVEVTRSPRYIDIEKCTGCGLCAQYCPIKAIDSYNENLGMRRAAYVHYPQAVPLAYVIDREKCIGCGLCSKVCLAEAVEYDHSESTEELSVGAVILAPGFDEFDARVKTEYGYGRYPNVVTSIEFERILSASGPYDGHVLRPSDGDIPENIAFIQCVGSRDASCGNSYCSAVCCTYAIKEAVIAKEHVSEGVEATIFFMDMRTYAKGFEEYYQRAQSEHGVRFIRCRISSVMEEPGTNNLVISYETENGKLKTENFDLVVLSVGLEPSRKAGELAQKLGVDLDDYGFCATSQFMPLETSTPGIFVCGAFQGPKDIPETVAQASGAAAKASELLASARGSEAMEKEYPPEIDVSDQEPRIGVFICHCGINIAGVVGVKEVLEYARELDDVVYAETNLYTCSQDTQDKIRETIREHNINRLVVASCTPRTHEPLFQDTLRSAGLNRYLFEMTNIRDQCSWVHQREPEEATRKAKDLVRMAVAKSRYLEPLEEVSLDLVKKALIVGGGMAGMTAALSLAEQGFESHLVEREAELGGNLRNAYYTLEGNNVADYLAKIVEKITSNELIHIHTGAEIESIEGFVGNFATTLSTGDEPIEHGAVIVATGGQELKPEEYLYGEDERVITQQELEQKIGEIDMRHETSDLRLETGGDRELKSDVSGLRSQVSSLKSVVMIQCVGSRCEERPYCSRICCSEAVKNALKLKELNPDINVYILYRDLRTYGYAEDYYTEAREGGVIFIRYEDDSKPEVVEQEGQLMVSVRDLILDEPLVLGADLVVLSTAVLPAANEGLAKMLKVPLTQDGFFLEAHVKLRPVDFATDGVYVCGIAHSPMNIEECISQASGCASRAAVLLSKDTIVVPPTVSVVDEELCVGCGLCEAVCQFNAIQVEDTESGRSARVTSASCKGCGTCGASCPQQAITMKHFTDEQLLAQVGALLGQ